MCMGLRSVHRGEVSSMCMGLGLQKDKKEVDGLLGVVWRQRFLPQTPPMRLERGVLLYYRIQYQVGEERQHEMKARNNGCMCLGSGWGGGCKE